MEFGLTWIHNIMAQYELIKEPYGSGSFVNPSERTPIQIITKMEPRTPNSRIFFVSGSIHLGGVTVSHVCVCYMPHDEGCDFGSQGGARLLAKHHDAQLFA